MSSSTPTEDATGEILWDAAARLRVVRRAHERFLALWAMERLLDAPSATARAWADLDATNNAEPAADRTPDNHGGMSNLHRGFFYGGRSDD